MYLEKLEIQGFKSFANKNILVFPGMLDKTRRGITAVVGPNGSGKSNLADAVRWVLGEQSMKTLRGKKSEDVIFSGSDKKGKLSMAEISLFLNNEDNFAPIDYSQVVLTRRLYRSGESEYLINNNKVRLSDVQLLLAKAKFGQKTYSVIGQGTVEGFLNTSLSERKEFFDEATGVKQYQMKRDDSLNKLKQSYENLNQAEMLLIEIEPRLKSLTRQVGRLHKRGELEEELKTNQKKYYSQIWHELNDKYNEVNGRFLEQEKIKNKKEKEMDGFSREHGQMEEQNRNENDFVSWQKELSQLQYAKDGLNKKLATIEAQIEIKLENQGQFDLSWLKNKKIEIKKEIEFIEIEIENAKQDFEKNKNDEALLQDKQKIINKEILDLEEKLNEWQKKSGTKDTDKFGTRLKALLEKLENAEEKEDHQEILEIINHIRQEIRLIISELEDDEIIGTEDIQKSLLGLVRKKEEIVASLHEIEIKSHTSGEKINYIQKQKSLHIKDLENIENKLKAREQSESQSELAGQAKELKEQLNKLEEKISAAAEKISSYSRHEEEKRTRLFSLQHKIHELQNEINQLNIKLNEIKVSAARLETKLEDMEMEIRQAYGDLSEIKQTKNEEQINEGEIKEKINNIKKQLDLIGGIDPEVEKEYEQTKERFDFLNSQSTDLKDAIKSLEEIIKELDTTIKEQFDKEFKIISQKFEEYFKILFNGGSAKVIKVMEDELEKETENNQTEGENKTKTEAEKLNADLKRIKYLQKHSATGLAGVEIQATPPGKKIKSISMLSGGERALVAIALICAIISSNPSPFVVLDEVDAALDEANSERLAKILDDLSHRTQFIVITHNRASMRRANILYGVTMQDDGVSKLLSIKLEDKLAQIS